MNRRKLLTLIAATALTPMVPRQIFASGGIANPPQCGYFIAGASGPEFVIPLQAQKLFEARRISNR